jgi:site-specific DNA recombinase
VLRQPTLDRLVGQRRENQTECELLDRLDELVDAFADGTLSRADYARARARVEARMDTTRRRLAGPDSYADPADRGAGAAGGLGDPGLSWRRAVLAAVVERVVLHPCLQGRNVFDPSRIEVVWRT